MTPHKPLAKIRLAIHSTVKSGAILNPSEGVIPDAPKLQTTMLFVKPPRAPAINRTKSIYSGLTFALFIPPISIKLFRMEFKVQH